jgi:hypothetical protein
MEQTQRRSQARQPGQITKLSELYPREWLSAADLGGKQVQVVVAGCEVRSFRRQSGQEEPAVVLAFTAGGKPCALRLVCNRTQARAMADLTGSEVFAEWVGTRVTLATTKAPNGKDTITIRPAPGARVGRITDGDDNDEETTDHVCAAGEADGVAADGVQADGAGGGDRVPPLDDL